MNAHNQTFDDVDGVETPSGKNTAYENFPVGSWLLPRHLRVHVLRFYDFARASDDIADNPDLASEEKLARLEIFSTSLKEGNPSLPKALNLRDTFIETGVDSIHAHQLLQAFRQDAVKERYANYEELMEYCRLSAAPVGRFLLDLHGERDLDNRGSDALCIALQLINHLQDIREDYLTLDRVYMPQDWMESAGAGVESLSGEGCSPQLRSVIDLCLKEIRLLLDESTSLSVQISNSRLAVETAVIHEIATALTQKLTKEDPLSKRVRLSWFGYIACVLKGVSRCVMARR